MSRLVTVVILTLLVALVAVSDSHGQQAATDRGATDSPSARQPNLILTRFFPLIDQPRVILPAGSAILKTHTFFFRGSSSGSLALSGSGGGRETQSITLPHRG